MFSYPQTEAICINQVGYYPVANKIALVVYTRASTFEIVNVVDYSVEFTGDLSKQVFWKEARDRMKNLIFQRLQKQVNLKFEFLNLIHLKFCLSLSGKHRMPHLNLITISKVLLN